MVEYHLSSVSPKLQKNLVLGAPCKLSYTIKLCFAQYTGCPNKHAVSRYLLTTCNTSKMTVMKFQLDMDLKILKVW